MPAHVVSDSSGRIHYLLTQEFNMSCGPACVAMANSIYKQLCTDDPEGATRAVSQRFAGAYRADTGTMMDNLSNILTALNIRNSGTVQESSGAALLTNLQQKVNDTHPAIVHVQFANGALHFVLCVRLINTTRLVILDPWYGLQELDGTRLPSYGAACSTTDRCSTGHRSSGNFSLWAIYTR